MSSDSSGPDRTTRVPGSSARFGLPTLTFLVIANMVGAGVFTTSGYTMGALGSPGRVILAWAIGGIIALAGAVSFARLARVIPESGGEYVFLARAAHPSLGYVAGWVSLIAGFTGAIAFAASTLEGYLVPADARPAWLPRDAVAILAVVVAGLLHGRRPTHGALAQNLAVASKLVLLGALIVIALLIPSAGDWNGLTADPEIAAAAPIALGATLAAFAGALVWISLSYSGFNAAVYVAGEVRDPERNVPRGLLLGTAITAILYIALNAIFVLAPPPADIVNRPDVAAVAAEWIGGTPLSGFVRVIIAIALVTSVSSLLMAGPRVYAKMASDGLFPRWLAFRDDRPFAAVALQMLLAIAFILVSTIQGMLSYLGLTLSLCAAATASCLFLPKIRKRPLLHPVHWLPLLYVSATLTAAGILVVNEPAQGSTAAATFAIGGLLYAVTRRREGIRATDSACDG